ncbi:hypothetical protein GB937_004838 [Aspergillus fischeri]|nr:hypothetical protein GB937_004838 [Aspergillus fischeri]
MAEPEPEQWRIGYNNRLTSGEQPFYWIDRPENLLFASGRFVGWNFFYSFECNDSAAQSHSNSGEDGEEPHNERGAPSSIRGNALEATGKVSTDDRPANSPKRDSGNPGPLGVSPPPAPADDQSPSLRLRYLQCLPILHH